MKAARSRDRPAGVRCAIAAPEADAPALRRMRPLLGTFVEVRVEGLENRRALRAIEQAFSEIGTIHRVMSFHESGSDLSRLHRAGKREIVAVDSRTADVLAWALRIARASAGRFDPTVAAQQVAAGRLPHPAGAQSPHPDANWRDIELVGVRGVRLARPLWIDLGGIAKGYAVDRALEILADAGATQACVNAGGDLRVHGARAEVVHLRTYAGTRALPSVELRNAALASSAGGIVDREAGAASQGPHIDGCTRKAAGAGRTVSVVATRCVVADALTKVVIAAADTLAARVLRRLNAQACVEGVDRRRSLLGAAA